VREQAHRGFTMVEVIVALVILGTSMLAIFGVLSTCSRASYHSRLLTKAVFMAESLMTQAMLKQPISYETMQGTQEPFTWQYKIAQTDSENLGAICVQVKWQEQQRPQQYELFSLVHVPPLAESK
jgi:prepilin-type N-terminal cleavage/methylation domain-containing protein